MGNLTLTQVARLAKSEWFLLVAVALSIALLAIAIYSFSQGQTQKAQVGIAWQKNIMPGKTTKEELTLALGSPVKTRDEEEQTSYFYPTGNLFRLNEVSIKNNTVALIKEQVIASERGKLSDYTQKYGPPETELFGQHGAFAPGYFWGQKGLLVFGNKNGGTIIEIWYFAPTTLEGLLNNNPDLSLNEPQRF